MKMRCPHCRSATSVRTSHEVSTLTRESYFACRNTACGHVFAAITEISRTVSLSAIPDPAVRLPLSQHLRRKVLIEQLQTLPTSPGPPPE